MDHSTFDDAGDYSADERYGKGIVDMEFEWSLEIIIPVMGQDVEESTDKVQTFARDVRNLEDRSAALRDELACSLDGFLTILDEDGDLAGAGRFKDARKLGDGLL